MIYGSSFGRLSNFIRADVILLLLKAAITGLFILRQSVSSSYLYVIPRILLHGSHFAAFTASIVPSLYQKGLLSEKIY